MDKDEKSVLPAAERSHVPCDEKAAIDEYVQLIHKEWEMQLASPEFNQRIDKAILAWGGSNNA